MIYTQISFKISPDTQENREILVAMLSELPFESFDETPEFVLGYIPGESANLEEINAVTSLLPFSVFTENEMIPDQNWNEVWEKTTLNLF
jgi:ribosomal protein L11 methyltransferase